MYQECKDFPNDQSCVSDPGAGAAACRTQTRPGLALALGDIARSYGIFICVSLPSFHEVKDYIQNYLTQLEKKAFLTEDKTELYLLFISCLEV
jgi:hypothetical protein